MGGLLTGSQLFSLFKCLVSSFRSLRLWKVAAKCSKSHGAARADSSKPPGTVVRIQAKNAYTIYLVWRVLVSFLVSEHSVTTITDMPVKISKQGQISAVWRDGMPYFNYWSVSCVSMATCRNISLRVENVRIESCCTDLWKSCPVGVQHILADTNLDNGTK